jgi:hypothetical protein
MITPSAMQEHQERGCLIERRFANLKIHRGLERSSGRTAKHGEAQVTMAVFAHTLMTFAKTRANRKANASP